MTDISKVDLTDDLTNIKKDYYTAAEVAQIKGVTRQAVNNDIHAGKYPGAFQLGMGKRPWLIPKSAIDTPTSTQDVVNITRQLTPAELQQLFNTAVQTAVQAEIQPLKEEIATLKTELLQRDEAIVKKIDSFIDETRAERRARENKGFFTRLFGK